MDFLGPIIFDIFVPILEFIAEPVSGFKPIPGQYFPYYFTIEYFQRPLIASIVVAIVAGLLGTFLLIRNLALIGDGLAHVSFGGIAVGLVLGGAGPLWYALIFSIVSAIAIDQMQTRKLITGDASIAIFLTGMLGLGLVVLRIWGGGVTATVEGYLWGSLQMIDADSFDIIVTSCVFAYVVIIALYRILLAIAIDPIAARVQGLPVRYVGLLFSIITATVVVSMVQIVGVLLVTALLVTPAATAQLIGKSFRSCVVLSQIIGVVMVILGLYFSAEYDTGSGSMIAFIAALGFMLVALTKYTIGFIVKPKENLE